ncbi:MAG: lamin tail domain-containing protein [Spirochaetes bacterium]|nr:lamin tail domain-containing protein [Spirochaetota bacterium]
MKILLLFLMFVCSCSDDEIQNDIPDDICGIKLIAPHEVMEGESHVLKCVLLKKDGTRTETNDVNYYVSDELLVSISEKGAEFLKPGNVVITASSDLFSDSCDVVIQRKINYSAVKIYCVMYDPSGADTGKEFIAIKNTWDEKIPLDGFILNAGSSTFKLENSEILPGEILYYCQDANTALVLYSIKSSGNIKFSMRNSGETIKLYRNELMIDCVYVEGGASNDTVPAEWGNLSMPSVKDGRLIKRISDIDTDTFADWIESSSPY